MSEERRPVETFEEDYHCDDCDCGYMRPTGIALAYNPPIYPHQCNNASCGATQNFRVIYPQIIHEPIYELDTQRY